VEVVAVAWVDHQDCPGNVPVSTAREVACSEGGSGMPDIQILSATAYNVLLANEEVIRTHFLKVGDYPGLLQVTVDGISDGERNRPQVLDRQIGSSSRNSHNEVPKGILM
jgi:hypothetical protein